MLRKILALNCSLLRGNGAEREEGSTVEKNNGIGARLLRWLAGAALLCAGWMAAPPPSLHAATQATQWFVSSAGNDVLGCGSSGNPCKTISYLLPAIAAGDQINVTSAITDNFTLAKNVAIAGAASASIDGNGARIITVNAGVNVSLSNLTLRNGGGDQDGGLIYNAGTLIINNATLTQSTLNGADGGAIYNLGTITIADTVISNNKAQYGGGIENAGWVFVSSSTIANNEAEAGGGLDNFGGGNAHLNRVILSNNSAGAGAGIYNDSGVDTRVLLTDTAVVSNTSQNWGAGIYNRGRLSLVNATVSSNHLPGAAGAAIDHQEGSLAMIYVTIAGNTVANSSGASAVSFAAPATIKNTVFANTGLSNCNGSATSAGYNVSSDGSCSFLTQATDATNVDARLGPLQVSQFAYSTYTQQPLQGSPLVNRIPLATCNSANDQRGVARPQDGACDIGAHEVIPIDLSLNGQATPASLPASTPLTITLHVTNTSAVIATGVLVTGDLPAGVGLIDCAGAVSCVAASGRFTMTLGTLNPNANAIVTVRLTPQQSGDLALVFHAAGNEWDRDMTNNAAPTNNVTVLKSADLGIRMSGMPTVAAHALFTMAVEVENRGELAADAPAFTLTLPANVGFVSAQGAGWNCELSAGMVLCGTKSPLPAKSVALVTLTLQSGDAPATLQLIGNATSSTFDPDLSNNTASQSLTVGNGSKVALPIVLR